jgi:hypothetical protein
LPQAGEGELDTCLTLADGHAERVAALHMIEPRADRRQAITLGADKACDVEDFVNELRSMRVTPQMAQNTSRRSSAIDGMRARLTSSTACWWAGARRRISRTGGGGVGPVAKVHARTKASRSELITSAFTVHMPCERPG